MCRLGCIALCWVQGWVQSWTIVLDYSVGGLGWRAARLAYTIAKRSNPAARAKPEGSLRCLCACPVSLPGLSGICLIHGIALWVDGMVDLDGFVHGLGILVDKWW